MRIPIIYHVALPTGGGLALLAMTTCAMPTEEGAAIQVRIEALSTTVVRGEIMVLRATALVKSDDGGMHAASVTFAWSSDDERIATVEPGAGGTAVVRGLTPGRVTVKAVPKDYRSAESGTLSIRVSNTIAIDSVVPDVVRYGEQVTVHGVGLGRVDQLLLGETGLVPVTGSLQGDPAGEGSARYWITYPARTGHALATTAAGFSAPDTATTVVVPVNLVAQDRGSGIVWLDGPPLSPDGILFDNPALALTSDVRTNVLRLARSDTANPLTIVVGTTGSVISSLRVGLAMPGGYSPDSADYFDWRMDVAEQDCQHERLTTSPGLDFGSNPITVTRTLEHTPPGGLDLRITGASAGRYSVRILDGHASADPRISPDRFEENDYCDGADVNATDPGKLLALPPGIAEILSIDQGFDVDWLRFTLDAAEPQLITIRTAALPFAASDSSDLGIALINLENFLDLEPDWTATSHNPGSNERLSVQVRPGEYYLAIVDDAGVPTRYALCAAVGNDCELPVEPSALSTRTPP